ncbi:Fc.00g037910.m01.CDS01 [Cosmosporella sp. VM-42]
MLEHLRLSGLLDEYYEQGVGTTQSNIWLSQAVKQITDRYPHVNILEIGGGTGGATKKILKAIDHSFDRYTFTDISPSFFENATEVFSPWQNKMVYKVCDAEKDPLTQGFVEGENDVVVASFVIHATAHLEKTMRNLRKLLKPGGFLVVGEGTRNGPIQIGTGFIFGTLPGWWLGVAEGRDLSPFVDISEWDVLLRRTGFSGIDTSAPPNFENFGLCLFVSQAVDDRVSFIRDPLSAPAKANIRKLVIVGGKTKVVRRLVEELTSIFKGILDDIITYETLQDVDFSICDTQATVISLSELDHPIFKNLTSEKWDSFRRMFESERTVLWVTSGRIADEPFSNMVVGFGRSAASEVEDLRLKFLDIPDASHADPKVLAESLIQLHARDIEDGSILGVAETEVIIDQDCHQLVPRLRPIPAANDRYNSVRRTISHDIDVRDSELELWQDGKDYNVRQLSRFETLTTPEGSEFVELQTTHAVLSALKTPAGHKFLVLGVDSSGNRYVTLASSLKSRLMVSNESTLLCNDWGLSTESLLILVAATVVSMAIIDPLAAGQTIVVHNASKPIALIASTYASVKGIKVIFTTDFEQSSSSIPWIKLPPFLGQSGLRQIIPNDISCFVGFSNDVSENELAILSNLSPHTRIETTKSIYSSDAVDSPFSSVGLLSRTLQTLGDHIKDFKILSAGQVHKTISLESLARGKSPKDPVSIVDWTSTTTSLPVRVNRLDVNSIFKPDKTYWLCGMTGALGISLCDWMIDRGARYLAFTSRNPQIEPSWLQAHRRFGITIRIFSCDMTDERALSATHQKIVKTLPPIIGALSGAMVLRDVSVRNMEIDQVLDVIRPKVIGSMHLDQIFHDVNLDFFILMSSLNCVIGNVGQANYTAANMGLCSIATNRRKRGLNSSCINVGTVIGAGYITENQKQLDQTVARLAIMHLSEDDFHQIFAEGVEAGYLDSPNGPELSAGLLDVLPDSLNIPKWASNPKFAHLIVHHAAGSAVNGEQGNVASIQEQLGDCKTEQNVLQVIRQTFSAQLRKILQQSTADDELLEMDSTSLGLDSLLSVDIRAWFLKNFQVNIPVLKIMNNDAQMASLAEFAAVNIPATLVPQLDGGSASAGDGASRITAPPS